jgi:IS1 family transposase
LIEHLVILMKRVIICSFCHSKQKNVAPEHEGIFGYGDVWTWTAIDADTKLAISWLVGLRNGACATAFIADVAERITGRVQLTTDGHKPYLEAIEKAFGADVDYAMLIKLFGPEPGGERRYSPPVCIGIEKRIIQGNPDEAHISTSYVERQNLTMRMSMRRFTRLTNAFSKKVQNLEAAVALHFMWYNFGRKHQTLKTTPAIAAGITDHVWTVMEIAGLLDN